MAVTPLGFVAGGPCPFDTASLIPGHGEPCPPERPFRCALGDATNNTAHCVALRNVRQCVGCAEVGAMLEGVQGAAAYDDPTLIHQVVAPAGSTLLFGEALIHATGLIRSDRERVIVIGGYTPPMFQAWNGQEPSAEFVKKTPEHLKPLISGSDRWSWKARRRSLEMPVAE